MPAVSIAGVQMDVTIGQKARNLEVIAGHIRRVAKTGAKLIVFPECALTGYCFDSRAEAMPHAETVPGPATAALAAACREAGAHAVVGMLERDGDKLFNAAVLVGPAGVVGTYRKVHLPGLGVDRHVDAGDRPFAVHEIPVEDGVLRVGMLICYDASFPEGARVLSLLGADVIALPTNWPPAAMSVAQYVVNTRANENHVFFIAVDRVGEERGFRFIGRSKICDCLGDTLVFADHDREETVTAAIDPSRSRNKHLVRIPGKHEIHRFRDRRPELYGEIVKPKKD